MKLGSSSTSAASQEQISVSGLTAAKGKNPSPEGGTEQISVSGRVSPVDGTNSSSASKASAGATTKPSTSGTQKSKTRQSRSKGEAKKKEEERRQRVLQALWPHSDHKKDFKSATGQDPDPAKLLSSTRWRDAWMQFENSSAPTTKDRTKLREMAVDIFGRKQRYQHRASSFKPSKSTQSSKEGDASKEEQVGSSSNKRKNRSSSHSAERPAEKSTPDMTGPQFKIPRTTENLEDDSMVVDGEENEPSPFSDLKDIEGALPTTADAVKGKKQEFPHLLFVHQGQEDRRKMSRDTWRVLYEKLQEKCLNLVLEGKTAPNIEWSGFKAGVGFIAPVNAESRAIVQDLVKDIKVAEFSFRAWARGEKGKYVQLTIRVPATMNPETFSAGKVLQAAILLNKLPEEKHVIYSCTSISKNCKDRILKFGAEVELFNAIKAKNGQLYVAASKLEVHLRQARITTNTVM